MKPIHSIKQIFSRINHSMVLMALIPFLTSIFFYTRQIYFHQQTFSNIEQANLIASKADQQLLEKIWDIVFGIASEKEVQQDDIIEELKQDIQLLKESANSNKERSSLNVSTNILTMIESYQNQIIINTGQSNSVTKNEQIMTDIDSLTQLLIKHLTDFVSIEIDLASVRNKELYLSLILLSIIEFFVLLVIIYYSRKTKRIINEQIQQPINQLIQMSEELALGHLHFKLPLPKTIELQQLTQSLNQMATDLNRLLEENALKQYHLAQSEARVLQAQITPHFIYNSLDAIISLIDTKDYDLASEMTYALSDFFRISLSQGKDWIFLERELKHIEDYLTILKIRYKEMLTFELTIAPDLEKEPVLKMILQPLVENAIYHGTKYVRRIGHIQIHVEKIEASLIFTIIDNGVGMTPNRLAEVQAELQRGIDSEVSTGYGLYNVHKRLLLYYGNEATILIDSLYQKGTTVTVIVPSLKERKIY